MKCIARTVELVADRKVRVARQGGSSAPGGRTCSAHLAEISAMLRHVAPGR